MKTWDAHACREQFPALRRTVHNHPAVYFDGPAGSQVPARVIEAVSRYLAETNANHDAPFATSRESDAILNEAHRAVADFLGTAHADCVVFGPNMTTLTKVNVMLHHPPPPGRAPLPPPPPPARPPFPPARPTPTASCSART